MTGSIRIFEKSNFTSKLSALVFLKVKLPNMTDWHIDAAGRLVDYFPIKLRLTTLTTTLPYKLSNWGILFSVFLNPCGEMSDCLANIDGFAPTTFKSVHHF